MDLITKYLHPAGNNFSFLVVIGVSAVVLLLLTYYILVIKCCLSWNRTDRNHRSFGSWNDFHPSLDITPESRGLDDAIIQSIPIFEFKKRSVKSQSGSEERTLRECAVCLNEYEEHEKLKIVPDCCHVFHLECINVWLRENNNCPLCRTKVSITGTTYMENPENYEDPSFIETNHYQRNQYLNPSQGRSIRVETRMASLESRLSYKHHDESFNTDEELGIAQPI